MYAYGTGGVAVDFAKARAEYEKIGELPNAQLGLAYLYRYGQEDAFPKDINRAEQYYNEVISNPRASAEEKESAELNLTVMYYELGTYYYYNTSGEQNYALAGEYCNKLLALGGLQPYEKQLAYVLLGTMSYEGGHGVAQNYAEAALNFEKAIALEGINGWDKAKAELALGKIYYYGQKNILPQNYEKALGYFDSLINNREAGDVDKATAKAYMGRAYYNLGRYVQAAMSSQNALGDRNLFPKEKAIANCTLGMMYYYGHGIHRDRNFARDYFNEVVGNHSADPADINIAAEKLHEMAPAMMPNPEIEPLQEPVRPSKR
jgi:tetratricopeptide (TPR) repeat protein